MISFTVHGIPAPQGSKRAFATKTGRAVMVESSAKTLKPWREAVKHAALDAKGVSGILFDRDANILLYLTFRFVRPKSHFTAKNELKKSAPKYPNKKPDLSKLIRAAEDAITDAGVWTDDCQVVDTCAGKRYCRPDESPGATITVIEMNEAETSDTNWTTGGKP
jgi:Holliday junction resolvase RusA-like endonuclease